MISYYLNDRQFFEAGYAWGRSLTDYYMPTAVDEDGIYKELYEIEENARCFTPFELYAKQINDYEYEDEAYGEYWDEFDKGTARAFEEFVENVENMEYMED